MSGVAVGFGNCVSAQIVLDSTLGSESSVVTPNGSINGSPSDKIDGGAIRETNLFHSFQEFNVSEGRGIYFSNPDGIENILSRVTGTNTSNIWGKLGVLGNANLFLINPNGIIFGQNASLDVKGSFIASTASSFKFNDQTEFSATASQTTPLLTISVPSGLQYGANRGRILVQGDGQGTRANGEPIDTSVGLRVQPNKTLALVGGDITLEGGTLKTAGGQIELGSVGSPSLVNLSSNPKGFSLSYDSVPAFGNIQLFQQATVDASGIEGGNIQVQGRRVLLSDGSQIESSTLGEGQGGTLRIKASDSVELIGESADALYSTSLATQVYEEATGSGGNLTIETGQLTVQAANAGPRASKFVITGRGGLPEDPGNPRNGDYSWADLRFFPIESQPNSPPVTTQPTDSAAKPLVEASGWTITSKGEVVLTAAAPSTATEVPWMTPSSCHAS